MNWVWAVILRVRFFRRGIPVTLNKEQIEEMAREGVTMACPKCGFSGRWSEILGQDFNQPVMGVWRNGMLYHNCSG